MAFGRKCGTSRNKMCLKGNKFSTSKVDYWREKKNCEKNFPKLLI